MDAIRAQLEAIVTAIEADDLEGAKGGVVHLAADVLSDVRRLADSQERIAAALERIATAHAV